MNKQELLNTLRNEYNNIVEAKEKVESPMQFVKLNERASQLAMVINFINAKLDEPKTTSKDEPKEEKVRKE